MQEGYEERPIGSAVRFAAPAVRSSRGNHWPEVVVERHVQPAGGQLPPCTTEAHYVFVHTGPTTQLSIHTDDRAAAWPCPTHNIIVLPAGTFVHATWGGPAHFISLRLQTAFVERAVEAVIDGGPAGLVCQVQGHDALVQQAAYDLLEASHDSAIAWPLYAETMASALALRLLRRGAGQAQRRPARAQRSADQRIRRVEEYIEAHLDRPLSVTALAAVAAMSPYHFARQFKQVTGLAPHRYVMHRRIERAKQLLRTSDLPLAEVALRVGCASQSHLSNLFRQLSGQTPSAFRRSL